MRAAVITFLTASFLVGCSGTSPVAPAKSDVADESRPAEPEMPAAAKVAIQVPTGFRLLKSWRGVDLYVCDYGNRRGYTPDYVTVVDLSIASIQQITGKVTGAPNGLLQKRTLAQFGADITAAAVLVNGTFFDQNRDPTPLAFGLKADGRVISYGNNLNERPISEIKVLVFDQYGRAWIAPYKRDLFDNAAVMSIIGGLDANANKSSSASVQRTFAGTISLRTLVLFSSRQATQALAEATLRKFGAGETIMLDGGSSTGLRAGGIDLIIPGRTIPHAIAVFPGNGGATGSW